MLRRHSETARPIVYLASMKTDPKIREMTARPEVALLLHESPTGEERTSWEMEITGRAEVVRDATERERAKQQSQGQAGEGQQAAGGQAQPANEGAGQAGGGGSGNGGAGQPPAGNG